MYKFFILCTTELAIGNLAKEFPVFYIYKFLITKTEWFD